MQSKTHRVIKKPRYAKMDGILYPPTFPSKCFREVLDYKPKPEDIFIVTYPKCGTTWMQNVALYIFRKGKELEDVSLFNLYCPFIDKCGLEGIEKMPRPGALKTHLPYTHMPLSSEAKYIYVARNPKDCCVSFYHHAQGPVFDYVDVEFDDFFEVFMAGEVEYNDYFDHLLSWYPHRNHPNAFYTTYEHMKEDIRDVILKLASFLGKEFIDAIEKDNMVLNNIIHYSSFEYMKQNLNKIFNRPSKFKEDKQGPSNFNKKDFIRKGIVGDWKNVFTAEQNERLDQKFLEKTRGRYAICRKKINRQVNCKLHRYLTAMASNAANVKKKPLYSRMDGIIYPASFSPKCFREALDYKPQSEDVFIVTYPKCGTTWMQNVALYIFRKGKELEDVSLFLKHCPFIDICGKEGIDRMPRPGALKTHLPYSHLPHSPEAKYVYVARSPKDCVVSFYHHTRNQPGFGYWDGEFDDFFELFMSGEVEYNEYYDHLLSWYPHRNDPNAFYTTYEEMKKDIKTVILRLAKFFGKEFIDTIEKDNSVLNNIVLYSGFEYMQKNFSDVYDMKKKRLDAGNEILSYEGIRYIAQFVESLNLPEELPELKFVRKGIVGDWKNALTEEQSERLNNKFEEKTKGTEIPNWFSLR